MPIYCFHQISKGFKPSSPPPPPPPPPKKKEACLWRNIKGAKQISQKSFLFPFSVSLLPLSFFFSLHHLNAWNKLCIKILTHCSLFCFSVFLHSVCKFHWFSYQHCYSLQEKRQTFRLSQKYLFLACRSTFTLNHCQVQSTGDLACKNKTSSNSFFFPQTELFIYHTSRPVKT